VSSGEQDYNSYYSRSSMKCLRYDRAGLQLLLLRRLNDVSPLGRDSTCNYLGGSMTWLFWSLESGRKFKVLRSEC
jgi:hypothetical protein